MTPIRTILTAFFAICLFVDGGVAQAQVFEAQVTAPDLEEIGQFGSGVAISGDTVLFGALRDRPALPGCPSTTHYFPCGSAFVFEDGSEPMTTGPEELQLLSPIPSLTQFQPEQMSLQPRRDTGIEASDLRNSTRRRPPALVPLYVTFAALQILDAHSTTRGLKNGAVEANPIMAPLAGNTAALHATKIAAAGAILYATEKIWRKNRLAAIMTMVAVNSGLAVVVHRNYGVASR
jgi:hypothetical protein